MIEEAIVKIVDKQDLTYDEAYAVMNEIMSGETSATQNAAFLAVQMLALDEPELVEKLEAQRAEAAAEILAKDRALNENN